LQCHVISYPINSLIIELYLAVCDRHIYQYFSNNATRCGSRISCPISCSFVIVVSWKWFDS